MASSSTHKDDLLSMVILMGMSGSGKSFFIDALKQGSAQIGNDLYSCTFLRGYSIFIEG
jgi:predicted GTPase